MMLLPVCLVGEKKVLPTMHTYIYTYRYVCECVQLPASEIFIDLGYGLGQVMKNLLSLHDAH